LILNGSKFIRRPKLVSSANRCRIMNYGSRIMKFHNIIIFSIFSVLISVDQLSKCLIRYFGGFYICNPGISWNISISSYIFWIFWFFIAAILLFLFLKKHTTHYSLFIIFILSGAVSNIIDRIYYGCVIDFIDLKFWPIFNLADIFIVSGAVFLLVKWKKM
jgi:lipoprotein signal peptidase